MEGDVPAVASQPCDVPALGPVFYGDNPAPKSLTNGVIPGGRVIQEGDVPAPVPAGGWCTADLNHTSWTIHKIRPLYESLCEQK